MNDPDCSLDLFEPYPGEERWRVRRMTGSEHKVLARVYGPFKRSEAEIVAQRASEKHRGDLVVVEEVQ